MMTLPPDWIWLKYKDTDLIFFADPMDKRTRGLCRVCAQCVKYRGDDVWLASYYVRGKARTPNGSFSQGEWAPEAYCGNREEALALAASYAWLGVT